MTVYVDTARTRWGRGIWSHLFADDIAELHRFATSIGCRREWFQDQRWPHYDVPKFRRERAIAAGAVIADRKMLVLVARRLGK